MQRTSSYVMTVASNDPRLPEILASVKRSIKAWNAQRRVAELANPKFVEYSWSGKQEVRVRARVKVRGRLGKNNPSAELYRRGGPLHRFSAQEIRPEHATRFDIYVNETRLLVPVKG